MKNEEWGTGNEDEDDDEGEHERGTKEDSDVTRYEMFGVEKLGLLLALKIGINGHTRVLVMKRRREKETHGLPGGGKAMASMPGSRWWLAGILFVMCIALGISARLISSSRDQIFICGKLTPKEIAEVKRTAREKIFTMTKGANPRWLPTPLQKFVWRPIKKMISDFRHPLEIIHAKTSTDILVWFRGPEQKAYLDGKEKGWALVSVWVTIGTNSFSNRIMFP